MESFINGKPPPPKFLDDAELQVNPLFPVWQKYNCTLMSWIYSSLNEDKLGEIIGCSTAFEIWNTLELSMNLPLLRA